MYEANEPPISSRFDAAHEELAAYFEALGASGVAVEVGDFALTLKGSERTLDALVRIHNGEVEYRPTDSPVSLGIVDASFHVRMACRGMLVQHVIRNDRSWDDIHIGYWCEFDRELDEYTLGFWLLLHAPWEVRDDTMRIAESNDTETELTELTVADLVEQEHVLEILSVYGLHCGGCPDGMAEDILEAARIHGLRSDRVRELIDEVETAVIDRRLTGD